MNLSSSRPDILASMEDRGYRITGPRRRVVELIEDKRDSSFTAEVLCEEAGDVGRATVYRTLKLLLQSGAICKLPMPDGTPVYQLAHAEHHHHAVCIRCGAIADFRDSTVEQVMRSIEKEVEGRIIGHRMEVYIVCSRCMPAGTV